MIDCNDVSLPSSGNNYSAFAGVFTTAAGFFAALGYEDLGTDVPSGLAPDIGAFERPDRRAGRQWRRYVRRHLRLLRRLAAHRHRCR